MYRKFVKVFLSNEKYHELLEMADDEGFSIPGMAYIAIERYKELSKAADIYEVWRLEVNRRTNLKKQKSFERDARNDCLGFFRD
jgi:hypothetical protein